MIVIGALEMYTHIVVAMVGRGLALEAKDKNNRLLWSFTYG